MKTISIFIYTIGLITLSIFCIFVIVSSIFLKRAVTIDDITASFILYYFLKEFKKDI